MLVGGSIDCLTLCLSPACSPLAQPPGRQAQPDAPQAEPVAPRPQPEPAKAQPVPPQAQPEPAAQRQPQPETQPAPQEPEPQRLAAPQRQPLPAPQLLPLATALASPPRMAQGLGAVPCRSARHSLPRNSPAPHWLEVGISSSCSALCLTPAGGQRAAGSGSQSGLLRCCRRRRGLLKAGNRVCRSEAQVLATGSRFRCSNRCGRQLHCNMH